MNAPFLGGLSSYGLILLVIAFVNLDFPQIYGPDGISTARILTHFFLFYGKLFDPNIQMINEQISVVPHLNFSSILIVLDPLNPANNIGKSTFNFDNIRQEFAKAYETIISHYKEFTDKQLPTDSSEK